MDLKEEDILGADIGRHWYYRSKAAALRRMVGPLGPQRLLDVGAGSGFFSRHLLTEGGAQSALCVDVEYTRNRDEVHADGSRVEVVNTVGAGDAFAAGLIYSYLKGWDWYRCARAANACGPCSCSPRRKRSPSPTAPIPPMPVRRRCPRRARSK